MGNSQASGSNTGNKPGNKSAQKSSSKLRLLGGKKGAKNEEWMSVVPDHSDIEKSTIQEHDNTKNSDNCRTTSSSVSNFLHSSSDVQLRENSTFIEEFSTPQDSKYSFLKNCEPIDHSTPQKTDLELDAEFQLLNNFKLNEYRARIDQEKTIKLSKLGITKISQISLEQDGTSYSSGGVLELDNEEQSNDEALENIDETVDDQEQNHHTSPPIYKRHMSVPLDCIFGKDNGSNLHKVQSFSRTELESRLQRPKFVPEKLDFKLYEKFEGHMLVNWYISELNPDDPAKSQLGIAELKLLAAQFCTHLLAAGVLKQLPDSGVSPTNIFRPDCIYYWSHAEIIQSQPQTPGKLSGIFWPPPASCEILASPNEGPDNTLHLVSQEKKSSARDVEILSLEEEIERLQQEVEKYKTLIEIQNLTASAVKDFSSPTEENRKICDAANTVSIKSTSDIATWISFYYNESSTQTELKVLNEEVQTVCICTNEKEIQTEPELELQQPLPAPITTPPIPPPLPSIVPDVNNLRLFTPKDTVPSTAPPPPPPPPPLPNLFSTATSEIPSIPPPPPPPSISNIENLIQATSSESLIPPPIPPPPLPELISGIPPPPPPPVLMPGIPPPPPPPAFQSSGAFSTPPPPPPPSTLSRNGPQPMPPPPPGGFSAQKAAIKKPPINPPVPMKPLFWTRILLNAQAQLNDNSSALWNEIEEIPFENFSTDFTKLFSRQVSNRAPTIKKEDQKPKVEVVKLLESKRSQNIGILAQSLRQDFHEIEHAIYNFDTSIVNLEVLQQIYEVKPTAEELNLINDHLSMHPEKPLDKPEQFIHDLSQIADYSDRIACLMFQVEFEDEITTIGHTLDNFQSICQFLGKNEDLKCLLSLVLSLGNYMNGGNVARGQADGFQVDILPKLKDVKGAQAGVTLLHFIVSTYVKSKYDGDKPPPLPVPEPGDVQRAMALDFESMKKELSALKVKLNECVRKTEKVINNSTTENLQPFKNKMEMFLQKSATELSTECDDLEECHKLFITTMKLYLFKPKRGTLEDFAPTGFFELWLPFCLDFKDIYKKEIIRLQIERAQELKQQKKNCLATIKERENGLKSKFLKAKERLKSKEGSIIS